MIYNEIGGFRGASGELWDAAIDVGYVAVNRQQDGIVEAPNGTLGADYLTAAQQDAVSSEDSWAGGQYQLATAAAHWVLTNPFDDPTGGSTLFYHFQVTASKYAPWTSSPKVWVSDMSGPFTYVGSGQDLWWQISFHDTGREQLH